MPSDYSLFCGLITSARHQGDYEGARKAFAKAAKSQIEWPEMLWEAWLAFEHSHGTVGEIQDALDIVERARAQVEARRAQVLIPLPDSRSPAESGNDRRRSRQVIKLCKSRLSSRLRVFRSLV
jgi:hypothetical protein